MLYRISVAERGLTGITNIFRSRLSGLNDLLRAGTVPLMAVMNELTLGQCQNKWTYVSVSRSQKVQDSSSFTFINVRYRFVASVRLISLYWKLEHSNTSRLSDVNYLSKTIFLETSHIP